ncbi:major latex protein 146-like [Papaver somniferum]|uniref:major latex protein 146-like n=1 Tax=Papaver somniferum TaxID=3469 RepID=UPI000E6F72FC|nr:major latex protein 146-like [Papaver somniferum]
MAKVMVQAFLRLGLLVLVFIGMAQIVGAQIETKLKCSADGFYNLYRHNVTQMSSIFPDYFKSIKIVEGDGISLDSIRLWQYVVPEVSSNVMVLKEMLKSVDDENKVNHIQCFRRGFNDSI